MSIKNFLPKVFVLSLFATAVRAGIIWSDYPDNVQEAIRLSSFATDDGNITLPSVFPLTLIEILNFTSAVIIGLCQPETGCPTAATLSSCGLSQADELLPPYNFTYSLVSKSRAPVALFTSANSNMSALVSNATRTASQCAVHVFESAVHDQTTRSLLPLYITIGVLGGTLLLSLIALGVCWRRNHELQQHNPAAQQRLLQHNA